MIRWIENVARDDIRHGWHYDCGDNSMLIQISDPPGNHPTPKRKFKEVHQFDFLDAEDGDGDDAGSDTATSELSANYGWFHVIEEIAERDVTKFDKIVTTQASTIFAHLSYKIDYASFQKQLLTKK